MATVLDEFTTRYRLDDQYSSKMAAIQRATLGVAGPIQNVMGLVRTLGGAFARTAGSLAGLVGIAGAGGLIGLGVASVNAAAEVESLRLALETATGSAESASRVFAELVEVAKLPGIGLEEAVRGFVQLFTVTRDAPFAIRMLIEFSNAIAAVGFGREELQRVIVNMTQVLGVGKLMGDELRETAQLLPQFRTALMEAFGAGDTEQLRKLGLGAREIIEGVLDVFARGGRAQSGLRVMFDNLSDLWFQFLAHIGGTVADLVRPIFEGVTQALQAAVNSNVFGRLKEQFSSVFDVTAVRTAVVNLIAWVVAVAEKLPQLFESVRERMKGALDTVKDALGVILVLMGTLAAVNLLTLVTTFVRLANAIVAAAKAAGLLSALANPIGAIAGVLTGVGIAYLIGRLFPDKPDPGPVPGGTSENWMDELKKRQREVAEAMNSSFTSPPEPEKPERDGEPEPVPELNRIADATVETAANTRKLVEFEMRRIALGGGELGRLGVTPIETHRIQFGGRPRGGGRGFDRVARMIAAALMDSYREGVIEHALAMRRAGVL